MKKRIIFIVILIIVSFLQLTAKEKLHLKVGTYENPPKIVTAGNGEISGFWADISGKDFGGVEKIAIIPFWLKINLVIMLVLEITILIYYRILRNQVNKKTIELQRNITKHRKTEDALRESEVRYRTLFNSSKDAIMTLEPPTWKFSAGNPTILDMFGVKDESEFASFSPWELSPEKQPDGRLSSEKAKEMIRIALKKGYNFFEWTHKRLNGEEFSATVLFARIKIYDKTFLQATVRDITEQKKSERIQKILYKITDAVNTTKDLNEFYKIIHEQLSSVIDTTNYYVALYDKETDTISLPYHVDQKDKVTSFPAGKTLTSYVIKTGKPLFVDKEVDEKLTKAGKIETIGAPSKIWLGVPLKIENKVIGIISVQSYTDVSLYTEKDIEILEFVSDTIAIAIERKQAEITRKKSERIQKMLYKIADAVNTTKDLNEFYKIIHEQLSSVIDTTNFYIAFYDKDQDLISFDYYIDEFVDKKENINVVRKPKKGLTEYVIRTGKPLLADHKVIEKLTKAGKINKIGTPSKIWLGIPLKIENEIIGMISVQSYTDASLYTEKDIEILEFVSDAISIAIERKKAEITRKKTERIQKMLYNIADAVNTTKDLNEFYKIIHEQLSSVIDTTNYYIALYDKETDTISLPYHVNQKDKVTSFPAGKTLTNYVIKTGKPLFADYEAIDKLTKAGKIDEFGAPSKIWLGVPLKIENEVMGMISVQSYTDASLYTEKDIGILEFVSDTIAIAIERKRTEDMLKESEEKYRLIVENANDGIEVTQGDKVIFANRQFAEMLGYKSDEIKNILFSQIYTEQAISDLYDRYNRREAGMVVPHQYETTFKKKDGTVIDVYIKYEIIDYKQEPATFAIVSNITDRKKAEKKLTEYHDHLEELVKKRTKKLKQTQAQLVRKEKLTVLGQLAGSIGHDLRNPLGVISNSVFYLNMKLKDKDEKVKKHLALLKKEIERSENMLSDLLDFSRVKLLNITETNVNTLIKETIEEIKIPEHIKLEMDLDEKIPQIPLDPDKMQRVFQNMISNAIQAMSEKGKLHIKTSSNDDFTEIIFSDNGQGIVKENLKKIFEPLVTTKSKGIGLGLAIAKNIIDSHKGKIDVKSKVGKGTTFTIKLRN